METVTRRKVLMGSAAATAVALGPSTGQGGAGDDAELFALIEEWGRVQDAERAVGYEICEVERALQAKLPEPPESMRFQKLPYLQSFPAWRKKTRGDIDRLFRCSAKHAPERRADIERRHRLKIADIDTYASACELNYNDPLFAALRARRWDLMDRDQELLEAIEARPARTLARVLGKMRATNRWDRFTQAAVDHPAAVTPKLLASVLRDLERMAGARA